MFFRAWHQLNVLPRFSLVHVPPRSVLITFFPAFVTGLHVFPRLSSVYTFSRAYHRITSSSARLSLVTGFPALVTDWSLRCVSVIVIAEWPEYVH